MNRKAAAFQSYLFRIWRADNDGQPVWRYSLRPIRGGTDKVFRNPKELLAFLERDNEISHDDSQSTAAKDE